MVKQLYYIFATRIPVLRGYPDMCSLLDDLVDVLCYEGCEGYGSTYGLLQPTMELAKRSHEQTYLGRDF